MSTSNPPTIPTTPRQTYTVRGYTAMGRRVTRRFEARSEAEAAKLAGADGMYPASVHLSDYTYQWNPFRKQRQTAGAAERERWAGLPKVLHTAHAAKRWGSRGWTVASGVLGAIVFWALAAGTANELNAAPTLAIVGSTLMIATILAALHARVEVMQWVYTDDLWTRYHRERRQQLREHLEQQDAPSPPTPHVE
jgi:hypothetical protein